MTRIDELLERLDIVNRRLSAKLPKRERFLFEKEKENILYELESLDYVVSTGGSMEANPKVWGVDESALLNLADQFGLQLENFRRSGKSFAFRIGVKPGTPRRRAAGYSAFGGKPGRKVQSPTFPRMALFILAMFDRGASRVQSVMGDWRSTEQFIGDLGNIRDKNIGSQMHPAYLGDRELNESDPSMEEAFDKIWGGY